MPKNFIELIIENLINDGIITESELEQLIEEAKVNSPLASLPGIQDDLGMLIYDSMSKDFMIQDLQQQNSELTYMVMMGGI